MPSRPPPFGSNTLVVQAYLASGSEADDAALTRWKQEHPDWFVAGTWKSSVRPTRAEADWMRETREIERQQRARGRPASEAEWLEQALRSATSPPPVPS